MQHYTRHIEKQITDKIQLALAPFSQISNHIRGPVSFIRKIGVKGTKEGFPCISCIMLHPNMKD